MHARIVTFRLDGPGHDEYEAHAVAIAESFNEWPGLLAKVWLADETSRCYGGVYLFASKEAADASRAEPQFLSLQALPVYTDLRVEEFDVLDAPTELTAGLLAGSSVQR
jgi:hypothetical protein